jgi:phosphatidate cytidylyltransferase
MLKRTISGAVYVGIIVAFFLLRSINKIYFDAFLYFLSFMGAFEVARAVKDYTIKGGFTLAIIFGATFTPVFVVTEILFPSKGVLFALEYLLLFIAIVAVLSLIYGNLKKWAVSILPIIYPAFLLLFMLVANHFDGEKGFLVLLLCFVISPCADVMAYLVGMTYSKIKKGNVKKLCPKLSPKKTVAGAIGGVVGGAIGGIIVYFIFKEKALTLLTTVPLLIFVVCGLIGSVLTEVGDLFESGIKRKVGIKDMGKIMPGHGGVMDRIDGMVFCATFITALFYFI